MAQHITYNTVGMAEDVSDIIYNISPVDTPLFSSAQKGMATGTYHEWQQDTQFAPAHNAQVEGADTTVFPNQTPAMYGNYCQIFEKAVLVSNTIEAVRKYGRASELARAFALRSRELKNDIEYAFTGTGLQAAVTGNAATARELECAQLQIAAGTTNTAGGARVLSEALLLDVLEKTYALGGQPDTFLVTPAHSLIVAGFAATAGRQRDFRNEKQIVNVVDLYVSPVGEVNVVLSRFLAPSTALVLDFNYWEVAELRPFMRRQLAVTGDNEKHLLNCELTLSCLHNEASGQIEVLTP